MHKPYESNSEIAVGARIDGLTGVLTRGAWEEIATVEESRAARESTPYAIVMIDIDRLKLFNDSAGRQAGDECLRQVAACISATARPQDGVGRCGGEEFGIVLPATTRNQARTVAERILTAVSGLRIPHPGLGLGEHITISIGVGEGPSEGGWEGTARLADDALCAAKRAGRKQVCAA